MATYVLITPYEKAKHTIVNASPIPFIRKNRSSEIGCLPLTSSFGRVFTVASISSPMVATPIASQKMMSKLCVVVYIHIAIVGEMADARLLLNPYRPIPSVLRDEGSTSMATVLFATVVKPKGIPCTVLTAANSISVPAAT